MKRTINTIVFAAVLLFVCALFLSLGTGSWQATLERFYSLHRSAPVVSVLLIFGIARLAAEMIE